MLAVRPKLRFKKAACTGCGCCAACADLDAAALLGRRGEKSLPGWSYKLSEGVYALDGPVAHKADFDDRLMAITYPFAASRGRDRVGDYLDVDGIDTAHHRDNPVAYVEHGKVPEYWALPIGLDRHPETNKYMVWVTDEGLAVCTTYLSRSCPKAEEIYHLYREGLLRGGSIGYRTLEAERLPPDRQDGHARGLHLIRVELLETTLTGMPANGDAVRRSLEKGYGGKSWTPEVKSLLAARASSAPVWAHGWTPGAKADDSGRWVTLEPSGTHVHIDSAGQIDKGPAAIARKLQEGRSQARPGKEQTTPPEKGAPRAAEVSKRFKDLVAKAAAGKIPPELDFTEAGLRSVPRGLVPDTSVPPQRRRIFVADIFVTDTQGGADLDRVQKYAGLSTTPPPLNVVEDAQGRLVLHDGNHRLGAALLREDLEVEVNVYRERAPQKKSAAPAMSAADASRGGALVGPPGRISAGEPLLRNGPALLRGIRRRKLRWRGKVTDAEGHEHDEEGLFTSGGGSARGESPSGKAPAGEAPRRPSARERERQRANEEERESERHAEEDSKVEAARARQDARISRRRDREDEQLQVKRDREDARHERQLDREYGHHYDALDAREEKGEITAEEGEKEFQRLRAERRQKEEEYQEGRRRERDEEDDRRWAARHEEDRELQAARDKEDEERSARHAAEEDARNERWAKEDEDSPEEEEDGGGKALRAIGWLTKKRDAAGHEHRDSGPGGGQFVATGERGGESKPAAPSKTGTKTQPSKAKVKSKTLLGTLGVRKKVKEFFGGKQEAVASAVGAPDDATVSLSLSRDGKWLVAETEHPAFKRPMVRMFAKDANGDLMCRNELIDIKEEHRGGLGADIFSRQVEHARALGVQYISAHAARLDASGQPYYNGFYTWARLGYDQPLTGEGAGFESEADKEKAKQAAEQFGVRTVQDLMRMPEVSLSTEEAEETRRKLAEIDRQQKKPVQSREKITGAQWWQANGWGLTRAVFELGEGSRSSQVLAAYLEESRAKKGKADARGNQPESGARGGAGKSLGEARRAEGRQGREGAGASGLRAAGPVRVRGRADFGWLTAGGKERGVSHSA